jgi:hypothetical protein
MAIGLRLPGLRWLLDVTPFPGFDFHPDAMGLIRATEDFSQSDHPTGYPLGLSTHLYLARQLLEALRREVDPTLLIRAISMSYGVLTVCLTGIVARVLTGSTAVALTAALFLALAPLHIINSHFGTADSTLVFFLWLSVVFGWRALRGGRSLDFVLFVASVGTALAVKFFIPLLLPLAIVVWHQERRFERAFEAALLLAGSFSAVNFFNYTPWDLSRLLELIRSDNVTVVGGLTPPGQLAMYSWESMASLGLAVWPFFAVGLARFVARGWRHRTKLVPRDPRAWYAMTRSPWVVPVSALTLHFVSLVAAGYHAPRHLLPFLPVMCFAAATGFAWVCSYVGASTRVAGAMLLAVVAYQTYNGAGTEARYANDIRNALAAEVADVASSDDDVVSFLEYSLVRGARLASAAEAAESRISAAFFVTCDMEYGRYLGADQAAEVFHPYGGDARLRFFQDLFAGRLDYRLVSEVSREDFTLEQRLATRGLLPSPGWFTPSHCALFARTGEAVAIGR